MKTLRPLRLSPDAAGTESVLVVTSMPSVVGRLAVRRQADALEDACDVDTAGNKAGTSCERRFASLPDAPGEIAQAAPAEVAPLMKPLFPT